MSSETALASFIQVSAATPGHFYCWCGAPGGNFQPFQHYNDKIASVICVSSCTVDIQRVHKKTTTNFHIISFWFIFSLRVAVCVVECGVFQIHWQDFFEQSSTLVRSKSGKVKKIRKKIFVRVLLLIEQLLFLITSMSVEEIKNKILRTLRA